ncbi:hypothetical protein VTJ49DRAFT_2160 [Mycothermus thermophilus]|uniref:Tr-type G domain-containing protein n=1 Tax=Humicola insolens TaxID=85995 RepID=A0ABR3VNV7_HUMIN
MLCRTALRLSGPNVSAAATELVRRAQLIRCAQRLQRAQSSPRCARSYATEHAHHEARVENIRNIGIIAHVDAGKTTTTERMLFYSGRTRHLGNVDHGNTTTDFLPMERERGITIQSAAVTFQWPPPQLCPPGHVPTTINLIDTPGHQDFRYEVDRCLPILDGAVCILDAVKGVETHTERVWESAHLSRIPRLLFVNKLDRDGASFRRSVLDAAARLRTWPLLCQIPWWHGDDFVGVIDVIHQHGLRFSSSNGTMSVVSKQSIERDSPALAAEMETARLQLVEALSEHDDQLMDEFLELEKDVPAASIKRAIRGLVSDGAARFTPVFAGASLRNIGVQPLLDAVVDYLPSPADRPPLELLGGNASTLPALLETGRKGHPPIITLGHVFKVVDDPHRGMLSWVRVYHGAVTRSSHLWNSNVHVFEKPQQLLHVSAKDHHEIQHLSMGHIGAVSGLKSARTGDTLLSFPGHHSSAPEALRTVRINTLETPPAVAFIAIDPYTRTARDKLEDALRRLTREDPSIRWSTDEKTDQLILSGMGLLHLEIARDRLLTHYKIDPASAMWGDIEVEYSECVLAPSGSQRAVCERTIRDKAGKAACTASVEPLEPLGPADAKLPPPVERDGNAIHVTIKTYDGRPPPFDADLVRQQLVNGAIAALARGPRRSTPVRGCRVRITMDPATDFFGAASTGGHITNAAILAVRAALAEVHAAGSVGLLEPFARVLIGCPEEAGPAIQHDIAAARGGHVLEVRKPEDDEIAAAGDGTTAEGMPEPVDISKVYTPPDPYESVTSLRDGKRGAVRMLRIVAQAPLKEMLKYDTQLRSMTGGRHTLQLDPGGFELVTGPREKALEGW